MADYYTPSLVPPTLIINHWIISGNVIFVSGNVIFVNGNVIFLSGNVIFLSGSVIFLSGNVIFCMIWIFFVMPTDKCNVMVNMSGQGGYIIAFFHVLGH